MKPYVITGGPSVGKTTVIDLLARRGYAVVPEAARAIIEEQIAVGGDLLPWKNLGPFQQEVAHRQWRAEQADFNRVTFLDRSLIDGYAYCVAGGIPAPEIILKHAANRYQRVFLLEPLEIYITDEVRVEDPRLAFAIHEELRKAYLLFGYEVVSVPLLPVEERVDFILEQIDGGPPRKAEGRTEPH